MQWDSGKCEPRKCRLSEFGEGECERVFTPLKKWGEFCCEEHRKRWHYLNRTRTPFREIEAIENAEARRDERVNGHASNGHDVAKPKLTLADLGLAQPTTQPIKRRKLKTDVEQRANAEEQRAS
jgi:hypothetical protein